MCVCVCADNQNRRRQEQDENDKEEEEAAAGQGLLPVGNVTRDKIGCSYYCGHTHWCVVYNLISRLEARQCALCPSDYYLVTMLITTGSPSVSLSASLKAHYHVRPCPLTLCTK